MIKKDFIVNECIACCNECKEEAWRCDECGNDFNSTDILFCHIDSDTHFCRDCFNMLGDDINDI